MDERGNIRELRDDEQSAAGEILISNETAGVLRRLTRSQRERFYLAFKRNGDEHACLNIARSKP